MKFSLLAGVIVTTSFNGPAFAGTYQCDNDRAQNQYPNCDTPAPLDWVHRLNQRGDWNGDDRLSSTAPRNDYFWNFKNISPAGGVLNLRVWLANAAFTGSAEYSTATDIIMVIDQNSAVGGWSLFGEHAYFTNHPAIQLGFHKAGGRLGADLIEIRTASSLAGGAADHDASDRIDDPALCGIQVAEDPALIALQRRMLDAVDHFRDVTGSFEVMFSNISRHDLVEFELSEQTPGSYVRVTDRLGQVIEHAFDGRSLVQLDRGRAQARTRRFVASTVSGARQYFTAACEPVFVSRPDPAAAFAATEVTLPQNYAFWLSSPDARIVGSAALLDRSATVVEGRHDNYLRDKLGASSFRMWIDDKTGALLRLVGSDEHGGVAYYVAVKDIAFDRGVDRSHFAIAVPAGWADARAAG